MKPAIAEVMLLGGVLRAQDIAGDWQGSPEKLKSASLSA